MATNNTNHLYLIKFYTTNPETGEGGWDINLAWVYAKTKAEAKAKLATHQGSRFDCVIYCEEHSEIVPLAGEFEVNTAEANLFIIN